jgi:Rod binding domain-containing protein
MRGDGVQVEAVGRVVPENAELGQSPGGVSPRLAKAAHEFEGQLMQELLKPMTNSDALTGEDSDGDSDAGSGGALGDFATEALGQALSQHGGFGIANRILKELGHAGNNLHGGK